jgi:WD40 repeat protein
LILQPPTPVQSLAFSANGRLLVAGERGLKDGDGPVFQNGHVSVWDAKTGALRERWLAHAGSVQCVALDPGGRYVATGGRMPDRSVCVWDLATGRQLYKFQGPTSLTSLAFDPRGQRLAAVGYEGTVYLWDPATGQALLTLPVNGRSLKQHAVVESQVVFSPDGSRLAVSAFTNLIYVRDGRPLPE